MIENIQKALVKYWGYDSFLPLQKRAMECITSGSDSIVVLPTGGGKSLCFQIPALILDGMAVVLSPLISLMKDQVDAARANGLRAAFLNSSLRAADRRVVESTLVAGDLDLIYVSPERFAMDSFVASLKRTPLA